jgi:hypothetical protein
VITPDNNSMQDWVARLLDAYCESILTVRCKDTYEMTPKECWYVTPFYMERTSSIQPRRRK